jgi:hypothetical protein
MRTQDIYDRLDELDPSTFETDASKLLHGLGFDRKMMAKGTKDMSGAAPPCPSSQARGHPAVQPPHTADGVCVQSRRRPLCTLGHGASMSAGWLRLRTSNAICIGNLHIHPQVILLQRRRVADAGGPGAGAVCVADAAAAGRADQPPGPGGLRVAGGVPQAVQEVPHHRQPLAGARLNAHTWLPARRCQLRISEKSVM